MHNRYTIMPTKLKEKKRDKLISYSFKNHGYLGCSVIDYMGNGKPNSMTIIVFFPHLKVLMRQTQTHTHRAVFRMWGLFLAMFRRSTWCAVCPGGSEQLWPGLADLCRYSDLMCDCLQHCQETDTTHIKSDLVEMHNKCNNHTELEALLRIT